MSAIPTTIADRGFTRCSTCGAATDRQPFWTDKRARQAYRLYRRSALTLAQVAEQYGTSTYPTREAFLRLGLPMRPKGRIPRRNRHG